MTDVTDPTPGDAPEAFEPGPQTDADADQSVEPDPEKGADQFVEDTRVEKVLRGDGLSYTFTIVAIADIELSQLDGGDGTHQMRDQVIDQLTAQRYGDDLGWGTKFPAGVLAKGRSGHGLEVVDFHHRIAGARRAGLTHVTAYVVGRMVEVDRLLLGFKLNRDHGKPLSDSERVRQAVDLLRVGHYRSAREAARVLGTDEGRVNKAKRLEDAQRRAAESDISMVGWARLGKNTQERLASIEAPGVFREAANKVMDTGLSYEKVNDMVKTVNAAPAEADKIEAVRSFGVSVDDTPAPAPRGLADAWHRCHMASKSMLGLDDADVAASLRRRNNADLQQLLEELTDLSVKVQQMTTLIQGRLGSIDDLAS